MKGCGLHAESNKLVTGEQASYRCSVVPIQSLLLSVNDIAIIASAETINTIH